MSRLLVGSSSSTISGSWRLQPASIAFVRSPPLRAAAGVSGPTRRSDASALARRDGGQREQDAQCDAQQCGEEHLVVRRQQERDRVGRDPEERNGLFEYEVPLHLPVERRERAAHGNGAQQCAQRASVGEDVGVGDLVERHEHGAERGVHGRADEQCAEQFHRAERSPHGGGHLLQSERLCEEGHARSEDLHGGRDPYAEESPHHGAGQQSEAGFVVASGLDAQADRLAGGREDAELQESQ